MVPVADWPTAHYISAFFNNKVNVLDVEDYVSRDTILDTGYVPRDTIVMFNKNFAAAIKSTRDI